MKLTPREIEVLTLVARGQTSKEIARHLSVSYHTVKMTIHHALRRNEMHSRTEAVAQAISAGLIEAPQPVRYGFPSPER